MLSLADAMGLLSREVTRLDGDALLGVEEGMAAAGIGRNRLSGLHPAAGSDPAAMAGILRKIREALEESPVPAREWPELHRVLGLEMLARLLAISPSSARRYLAGTRSTPDAVAARLHFLALVVGDLAGAYNDIGVRRWFDRPRKLLDGSSPARLLGADWLPEDPGPQRVRELAGALAPSPAT